MTHQYKQLPVAMKMWMQFNVMPRTIKLKTVLDLTTYGCDTDTSVLPFSAMTT